MITATQLKSIRPNCGRKLSKCTEMVNHPDWTATKRWPETEINEQYESDDDTQLAIEKYYEIDMSRERLVDLTIDLVEFLTDKKIRTSATKVGVALRKLTDNPRASTINGIHGKGSLGVRLRRKYSQS